MQDLLSPESELARPELEGIEKNQNIEGDILLTGAFFNTGPCRELLVDLI